MGNYEQYLICKERGHESNGSSFSYAIPNAVSWYTCKYCCTRYATQTTTELLEENVPKPPKEKAE